MAERGFNIVMIARNQQKLNEASAKVTARFPRVKVVTISADLSKMHSIQEYKEKIVHKLKDLDIAMLFLNAGVAQMGKFQDIDESSIEDIMMVNAVHPMYLAKALLGQMLSRGKKSAIIVTSSVFGQRPIGGASIVYSATKSLASFLAQGLSYELDGKLDVLSWECGEVATNMSKRKAGGSVATPKAAVTGMLAAIGRDRVTNGAVIHDIGNYVLSCVPLYYANKMFINMGETVLKKQRARAPQVVEKKQN